MLNQNYHISDPTVITPGLAIVVIAGSRNDPYRRYGLAHLVEHIIHRQLKNSLENLGILVSAQTHKDFTQFTFLADRINQQTIISAWTKAIRTSSITHFTSEKRIIANEINQANSKPLSKIHELANQGIWQDKQYSHPILGLETNLTKIKASEVKTFVQQHYTSDNTSIILLHKSSNYRTPTPARLPSQHITPLTTPHKHYLQSQFPGKLCWVSITYTVPIKLTQHTQYRENLIVAQNILGGQWNSLLNAILRQQMGNTYWVHSWSRHLLNTSYIRLLFAINKTQLVNTLKLLNRVLSPNNIPKITTSQLKTISSSTTIKTAEQYSSTTAKLSLLIEQYISGNQPLTPLSTMCTNISNITTRHIQEFLIPLIQPSQRSVAVLGEPTTTQN